MKKIWLLRHGQTDWNLAGRWQGQSPRAPGLNETGQNQALAASEKLKNVDLAAIYSSDLLRARQTAETVGKAVGLRVNLEPRFREIHLGEWEGMLSEDIQAYYPQELAERAANPFQTVAPNGESPSLVSARVLTAVNEIMKRHHGVPVLIVGHGISLAAIICRAEGYPEGDILRHIPDNAHPFWVPWAF